MIHALSTPYSHGDAQRRSCRFRISAHVARMSDVESHYSSPCCHNNTNVTASLLLCPPGSGRGLPGVGTARHAPFGALAGFVCSGWAKTDPRQRCSFITKNLLQMRPFREGSKPVQSRNLRLMLRAYLRHYAGRYLLFAPSPNADERAASLSPARPKNAAARSRPGLTRRHCAQRPRRCAVIGRDPPRSTARASRTGPALMVASLLGASVE